MENREELFEYPDLQHTGFPLSDLYGTINEYSASLREYYLPITWMLMKNIRVVTIKMRKILQKYVCAQTTLSENWYKKHLNKNNSN